MCVHERTHIRRKTSNTEDVYVISGVPSLGTDPPPFTYLFWSGSMI